MKLGLFKRFKLGKGWIYFVIQIKTIQMQNWTFILNKCQNCWNPKHLFFLNRIVKFWHAEKVYEKYDPRKEP